MRFDQALLTLKTAIIGAVAAVVLAFLGRSVRWKREIHSELSDIPEAAIITFWHGRLLMMPRLYFMLRGKRKLPPYMLISQHGDGRIIALATRLLGIHSVAGSSSRGGLRALLELIRLVSAGADIGFTPDGPRGPRYELKEGVITAAAKTGAPIILCAYSTDRRWQLKSWDGMIIPKPFARGIFLAAKPIWITDEDDLEAARLRVQSALHELTERADRYWSES
jgi:lysophospholipid acyltransferase (LPLAT)-like uncharacterized protein